MLARSPDREVDGVLIFKSDNYAEFERAYLEVRKKERRLLTDSEVARLPHIGEQHPHYREWIVRQRSTAHLLHYIGNRSPGGFRVLDLGCGNGWFANRISQLRGASVTALDVNLAELRQGRRVFRQAAIQFCFGDLFSSLFQHNSFDYIVMNCMAQYFPELSRAIDTCLPLLGDGGELHIVDSPFYADDAVVDAARRSHSYYTHQECGAMSRHYFHHRYTDVQAYSPCFHHDPREYRSGERPADASPFPWLSIAASAVGER